VVKRRSLDEVLSADEQTFLKKGTRKARPIAMPELKPEKKEEPPMPQPIVPKEDLIAEPQPVPTKPVAAGQPLSIHARIDPTITTALLRASFERRLEQQSPWMQRDIIAEALGEWLKKHGYLR
jgi:hypothetical protein